MAGRHTKLTPQLIDDVTLAIRNGNYAKVACEIVGIGSTTFYRWLETAEKPNSPKIYREFRDSIKRAEAIAEARNIGRIQQAAEEGTWQASAWYLERKHADRWGRNDKVRQEITGANGGAVTLSLDDMKKAVSDFLDEGADGSINSGTDTE